MSNTGSIAVLTTVHPALDGRIFHKEAISLRAAGFPVTLIAPYGDGVAEATTAAGIGFEPLARGTSRSVRPRRWVALVRRLWARRRADSVWHFHDPELLVVCVISRALFARSIALVYDAHEDPAGTVAYKEWLPRAVRRPIAALTSGVEGLFARRCELVIAATEPIAAAHARRRVEEVVVVRNYPRLAGTPLADPPERASDETDGPVRVVYSGSITAARGVHEMVAAIDRLADLEVELELIGPFGDPELRREVEETAGSRVEITGLLPWADALDRLARCDIGLVCLHPEPNYVDSLPTKLFEYFAAGLAVVASDFEAWAPYVVDVGTGIQVAPRDVDALAGAIRELAVDADRRAEMGRRARRLAVERFTWAVESERMVAALDELRRRAAS